MKELQLNFTAPILISFSGFLSHLSRVISLAYFFYSMLCLRTQLSLLKNWNVQDLQAPTSHRGHRISPCDQLIPEITLNMPNQNHS